MRRSRPEARLGEEHRPEATTSRPADDPDRPGDGEPSAVPAGFDAAHCKRRALDLLARREHSRRELERKLAARGFGAEAVATALDDLERSGALAADRFTEAFVRSRAAKGQGPVRIRAELAARGIDEAQAAAAIREAGVDWAETARTVYRKRFGSAPPSDFKERARQARFLEYRGFDRDQIRSALGAGGDSD